jgi:hypothetical protein
MEDASWRVLNDSEGHDRKRDLLHTFICRPCLASVDTYSSP